VLALRDDGAPSVSVLRGDLAEVRLGPRLSEREWRTESGTGTTASAGLGRLGQVVQFRVTVRGLADSRAPILWSVRHASNSKLVSAEFRRQTGAIVAPPADQFTGEGQIWVPMPRLREPLFVELRLLYEGRLLDTRRTPSFRGAAATGDVPATVAAPASAAPDNHRLTSHRCRAALTTGS
jgi:hypothetical protein